MSDILVRNVDPALKRALKARARANERSLSDEVKALLDAGMKVSPARPAEPKVGIGTQLRSLIPPELWTDDFLVEREAAEREPPDFS